VFWPLQWNFEISGIPKDSQVPILGVWVSSSHSLNVGLWHLDFMNLMWLDFEVKFDSTKVMMRKFNNFLCMKWLLTIEMIFEKMLKD